MLNNYLRFAYFVVVVMSVVFFIFHPKDVLGFWVISIKKVCSGIGRLIKKLFNKIKGE